jgi:predicted lipid-binding transport protein (Tim44 family)
MSIKFFELLFFAIISIVLINRLLSMLGEIEEEDRPQKPKSSSGFFNGSNVVVDVTDDSASDSQKKNKVMNLLSVFQGADAELNKKMIRASNLLGGFDKESFLLGSKAAFEMIINASIQKDDATILELVDKRYIEDFHEIANSFCEMDYTHLEAKIDDINIFGNNVMIKVEFLIKQNDKGLFNQFWTFTKSAISEGPNWHLTNIDLLQIV